MQVGANLNTAQNLSKSVTSPCEEKREQTIAMAEVFSQIPVYFQEVFQCEWQSIT